MNTTNTTTIVPFELARRIQQARRNKNMTQNELATLVNEKKNIIEDYESGRAKLNEKLIARLEKALGVHLTGNMAGLPLL